MKHLADKSFEDLIKEYHRTCDRLAAVMDEVNRRIYRPKKEERDVDRA